ncbi:MAG TPA: hypothetical protein V6D20_18260 [Candidatus Obscuribacterales bacterium]
MFTNELSPLLKELASQPVAFLGGFVSGILRLNLTDEPVKSWLDKQAGRPSTPPTDTNGHQQGPQSITID